MSWSRIVGHERIKKILQKSILDGRIPSAYLLWGLEGIGKEALAIEFAKTCNCEQPIISGSSIDSCGSCRSCREFEHLSHPNLYMIFSLPPGKIAATSNPYASLNEAQIEEIQQQITLKAADNYHKIALTKASQIKIASIRSINKELSMSASSRGRRVVLIINAEEMTAESANAFLKNLEEPAEGVTIFLTTSKKHNLLPTILSRCQQLRCSPLSIEDIRSALINKYYVDETTATLAAAIGDGSLLKARQAVSSDMSEFRNSVVAALRTSFNRKVYRLQLNAILDELLKTKDAVKMQSFLLILMSWLRDSYIISTTGSSDLVINKDQRETLEKFSKHYGDRDLAAAIALIEDSVNLIPRNVMPELIFLSLFRGLREIFLV